MHEAKFGRRNGMLHVYLIVPSLVSSTLALDGANQRGQKNYVRQLIAPALAEKTPALMREEDLFTLSLAKKPTFGILELTKSQKGHFDSKLQSNWFENV